jgi:hypothetical protein
LRENNGNWNRAGLENVAICPATVRMPRWIKKWGRAHMQIVDEQLKLRAQANMILHATELAVAKFITDNAELKDLIGSNILKKIKERRGIQAALSARSIDAVVQECYLDELVGLAIDVAKGTGKHELLVRLRGCLSELHIFEIRQTAAHPVRPF